MLIKTLYLCEKPSQARDIAKSLGCHNKKDGCLESSTTIVTWCFGHLLETAAPDVYCADIKPWRIEKLPIVPTQWKMVIKKESSKQVKIIKALLKEANEVVIATDADREGEVIARELLDLFKFKGNIKRLWLSALDDASIKKSLATMRDGKSTENLYYAGLGRQRADWLIGMNITMAASVAYGRYGEGVLSVGRVQTPTLKLVVDRDKAIDDFKSTEYFELFSDFKTHKQDIFTAKWEPRDEEYQSAEYYILDKNKIEKIAGQMRGQQAQVEKFEEKNKKQNAPLCLSLSQLQKLASSRYGFSAKETLETAQSLYETHKAITYPRTDCSCLPRSQLSEASTILSQLKLTQPAFSGLIDQCSTDYLSPVWDDSKITAHHAMIPTLNSHVSVSSMSESEQRLYDLVCRYYIAQFLGCYEYAERSVSVQCAGERFKAASQTPLRAGWKQALTQVMEKDDQQLDAPISLIPKLEASEALSQLNEKVFTKHTKQLARFTEGTLIEAMKSISKYVEDVAHKKTLKETAGIGTEATRAAIIETLFKRAYIERKGKQLFATEKGKQLIASLPPIACDPVLTAEWEQALDKVAEGKLSLNEFIATQTELLYSIIKLIQPSHQATPSKDKLNSSDTGHHCPQCQKSLIKRQTLKDKRSFWACTGYPVCRFTTSDQNNSPKIQFDKGATNESIAK